MGVAPVTRLGRYTLVRSLGAGGMAELFLARADGLGGFAKLVALKRILPHKASNERFVRMLVNEAKLVATLDHPNIAQVYDIGQDNNEYFFAMEYVHGQDLRHVLHAAPEHRLQVENALHVAIGVCAGLHHAHEARDPNGRPAEIVHRDITPSNVLVSYQGAVKLVDFGVAKAASLISETREGVIKGKYGYMSPEQCLGAPLDRRSDLFAVGILLWEMTVGRRLYKLKGDFATLQRVVYVDAPSPARYIASYPPELERIVMRALCRDPEGRYATAEQMQLELEQFALENRFPVSAVSMSMEMRQLFRQRVDAWAEAQQHGRSLADHLAEISSDDALASSNDDDIPGLDDVLGDLEVNTSVRAPTPTTFVERPPQAAPERAVSAPPVLEPARTPVPAPLHASPALVARPMPASMQASPARRGRVVVMLSLIAVAAIGVALWAVFLRKAPAPEASPVAVVTIDAASTTPVVEQVVDAVEATITVDAEAEPEIEIDPTPIEDEPPVDAPLKATAKKKPHSKPDKPDKPDKPHVASNPVKPEPEPPKPPPIDAAPAPREPSGPAPGTVDAAGVRAVVRSHIGEISACVSRAKMENRDLTGKLTLRIDLAPSGVVTATSVISNHGATPALESCMRKAVAGWRFPAPAGNMRAAITYPFAF